MYDSGLILVLLALQQDLRHGRMSQCRREGRRKAANVKQRYKGGGGKRRREDGIKELERSKLGRNVEKTCKYQVNDVRDRRAARTSAEVTAGRRRGGGEEDFPGRSWASRARRSASALPSE